MKIVLPVQDNLSCLSSSFCHSSFLSNSSPLSSTPMVLLVGPSRVLRPGPLGLSRNRTFRFWARRGLSSTCQVHLALPNSLWSISSTRGRRSGLISPRAPTFWSGSVLCHQNWNVTKTEMSPKLKYHQNWIVTKKKCHQNINVTQIEMSQNWKSPKLNCHQNWNVTKSEMFSSLKMFSK